MGLAAAATVALRGRRDLAVLPAITAITFLLIAVRALSFWPAPLLVALGLGLTASRFQASWLARGQLGGAVTGWIAAFVATSVAALVLWWVLVRPDISDLPRLPSGFHPIVLVAGIVVWAACNAAAEELYFRGHSSTNWYAASGVSGFSCRRSPSASCISTVSHAAGAA